MCVYTSEMDWYREGWTGEAIEVPRCRCTHSITPCPLVLMTKFDKGMVCVCVCVCVCVHKRNGLA